MTGKKAIFHNAVCFNKKYKMWKESQIYEYVSPKWIKGKQYNWRNTE